MSNQWLLETERRRTRLAFEGRLVLDYPEVVGLVDHVRAGAGLDIVTMDLRTSSDICLTARDDGDPDLITGLAVDQGDVQHELPEIGARWLSPGGSALAHPSRRSCDYRCAAHQTVRVVAYDIDATRLLQAIDGEPASAVETLRAGGPDCRRSQRFLIPSDATVRRIARDVIAPGCAAALRGLRIEARALDMIERQLALLCACADAEKRSDRETRVGHAVELLCQDLRSPPSPRALARLVGLSERQLQAGFRAHVGAPVAQYLREQRLAQARAWLASDLMPLGEVAERVGYANSSNLIKALRRRYGITPMQLRAGPATSDLRGEPKSPHGRPSAAS